MSTRLAPEIQLLLQTAVDNATERDHAAVTAEHLLLAMIRHRETARALRTLGLDTLGMLDALERHLSERVPRRRFWQPTPRPEQALLQLTQRALLQALSAQIHELRIGDLLAALLHEPSSRAAEILRHGGLRRLDLLRYLEHGIGPRDPALHPAGATRAPGTYRVILHNDHYTTMEFVRDVLQQVFQHAQIEAERIMLRVHQQGSGVAGSYPDELAAIKANDVIEVAEQAGYPLLCTLELE